MKIFIFVLYANTTFEQIIAVEKFKFLRVTLETFE